MEKENLWVLLGKQLNGEITEEERTILQQLLLENNQDISYLIEFLEHTWGGRQPLNIDPDDARLNDRWEKLSERIADENEKGAENAGPYPENESKQATIRFSPWMKVAASVIIIVGISVYFLARHRQRPEPVRMTEIVVRNGSKKYIELPDGTGVWLNADSRLTYHNEFSAGGREVWLDGEALFNVKKDASAPFTVRTSGVTIKVLGTVFNVEAYKDEPDIQTTLISGKVQVSLNDDPEKKIVLSPREKLTVMSGNSAAKRTIGSSAIEAAKNKILPMAPVANKLKYQVQALPVNPIDSNYYAETAWVNDKLVFAYETFGSVAQKMERRYNVQIIFKDKDLEKVVMSGVFDKETIGQAMQVLQMMTKLQYQRIGDTIFIYK